MANTGKYLRNAWYMAAWSDEVGDAAMLRRRLLGQPIMLLRRQDGGISALTDRCPHRFAPLSQGTREGDVIRCAYHGLGFDTQGQCVHNPFSDTLPKGASVRQWPAQERDGIIWFWAGDPATADPALIPDFASINRAGLSPIKGLMGMKAPYQFATDNLMDLSHIEFVHKGSFAGNGVIFAGKHELRQEGQTLHSNWWMPDVPAPPHTMGLYEPGLPTDHWLDMRWDAPASMLLEVGATPTGKPRTDGIVVHQAHIITPESDEASHYFWATTRSTDHAQEEMDAMVRSLMEQAFNVEDKPIIEASYDNLDGMDFWEARPTFLGIDSGGTKARRVVQQMIAAEQDALEAA
ncbi:MAG: Rieske 2Fe-2S domain-containing protein [Sphingobium sp.]